MSSESFKNSDADYNFKVSDFVFGNLKKASYNYENYSKSASGVQNNEININDTETVDFEDETKNTNKAQKVQEERKKKADAAIGTASENQNFSDFNDYNNIAFETSFIMHNIRADYTNNKNSEKYEGTYTENGITHVKVKNTKVKDLIDPKTGKKLYSGRELDAAGGGEFEVVEVLIDENGGFDALILKDSEGNYQISYGFTNGEQFEDIISDLVIGFAGNQGNLDEHRLTNLAHELLPEKDMAEEAAKYAYELAKKDGKKLNFKGYSLGGALCEYGYLAVADEPDVKNVVDSVTLNNPLHAAMSSTDVNKLKDANNLNLYASEVDFVHTINHYDDFKDIQKLYFADKKGFESDQDVMQNHPEGGQGSLYTLTLNNGHRLNSLHEDEHIIERFENGYLKTVDENGNPPTAYNRNELLEKYVGFQLHDFYSMGRHELDAWASGMPEIVKDAILFKSDAMMPYLTAAYSLYTVDITSPASIYSSISKVGASIATCPVYRVTDLIATGLDFFGLEGAGNFVQDIGTNFGKAVYNAEQFMSGTVKTVQDTIVNAVKDTEVGKFISNAKQAVEDVADQVHDAVADAADQVRDAVVDIATNTGAAIAEGWSSMCSAIGGLFGW